MKVFRISMVIASLSPLFIIWAISGQMPPFQGVYFEIFCIAAVIVPNAIWRIRLKIVKKKNDTVRRTIWKTVDSSHYLFTYLLTMLMPFYVTRIETYREFLSVLFALSVIVFLFWRFNTSLREYFSGFMWVTSLDGYPLG